MTPKVERHPWWTQTLPRWFEEECGRYAKFLEGARRAPRNLHLFFTVAEGVYLAGSVVDPAGPHVANALRWSAQALTAIFVFQEGKDWPADFVLGRDVVRYTKPVSPREPDLFVWQKAFHLGLVSRQPALLDHLCQVTPDAMRRSALQGFPPAAYMIMDLDQAVWTNPDFVNGPAFARRAKDLDLAVPGPPGEREFFRRMSVAYLEAARALGHKDGAAFQAVLADGLEAHRAYWTSSDEMQRQLAGMVDLPLTALAALAWDRGLRFEADSGYLPWSWVTGELFTRHPAA